MKKKARRHNEEKRDGKYARFRKKIRKKNDHQEDETVIYFTMWLYN